MIKIHVRPESATNETSLMECNTPANARIESIGREHIWHQSDVEDTVRECHNQKNCQEVSQSKEHQESATIKAFPNVSQSNVLPGSAAIIGTARQYYKKCIQGVLQLKVRQGSVAIKSTARECQNLST